MQNSSKKSILFEGTTLEEAYKKASLEFKCSMVDLESEVVQTPRAGILGLLKRNAIIKVYGCQQEDKHEIQNKKIKIKIKDISSSIDGSEELQKEDSVIEISNTQKNHKKEKIFDSFYNSKNKNETKLILSHDEIVEDIRVKINDLFSKICYDIDEIKVSMFDNNTVFIEFSGEDAALLIGKEGYRYKALSYALFNWIHDKYNFMIRLEVAQFLVEQEKSVKRYLVPVIETIKEEGFFKTKTFDGILVHIALSTLREEFPNKYVAVKVNQRGEKYILVNEYNK